MAKNKPTIFDQVAGQVPGWMFVAIGLAVLSSVILMPAWLSLEQVRWQLNVMRVQSGQFQQQLNQYQGFEKALSNNNPTVLKRLAYVQLRQVPKGAHVIKPPRQLAFNALNKRQYSNQFGQNLKLPAIASNRLMMEKDSASVSQWLAKPVVKTGSRFPTYQQPTTLLVRLCTGPSRWVTLTAGMFCLVGGLYWRSNESILSQ